MILQHRRVVNTACLPFGRVFFRRNDADYFHRFSVLNCLLDKILIIAHIDPQTVNIAVKVTVHHQLELHA